MRDKAFASKNFFARGIYTPSSAKHCKIARTSSLSSCIKPSPHRSTPRLSAWRDIAFLLTDHPAVCQFSFHTAATCRLEMVSRWEIDSYRGGKILENSISFFFFGNLGSLKKEDLKFGWIMFFFETKYQRWGESIESSF